MADAALTQTVHGQMVAAMKAGDKARTQVLRMVLSEIRAQESDKPEADPTAAVSAYAKKLKKAQADMERLKQSQHVAQLQAELAIVEEFLPKQLDDAALAKLVDEAVATFPGATAKEMGKVVGAVMKVAAGTADAGRVRALVQARLPA